mgnify:CR=1 FL=1|jgi:hypothetical protein
MSRDPSLFGCPFGAALPTAPEFIFSVLLLLTHRPPPRGKRRSDAESMTTEELHMDALSVSDAGMDDDDV